MSILKVGSARCRCDVEHHEPKLVVVTGGPGGGKSAVLEMAARAFCRHVACLPEAASIVFGGGFPRHDSEAGRRAAQRAIFRVQREIEALVLAERAVTVALCDRGTVDGWAYWDGPRDAYWREIGSSLEEEITRYSAVIHLETPREDQGYNHENPLRVESAHQAAVLDARIREAWRSHPRRSVIASGDDFGAKALAALTAIRAELAPCCRHHRIGPS